MSRVLWRRVALLCGLVMVLTLAASRMLARTQAPGKFAGGVPAFLQPDQCFQFSFTVTGAPNWKVLDVLDAGWIRAEVDEGPASAQRASVWINTAQILTARSRRCSQ